jgi:hypothetical protein
MVVAEVVEGEGEKEPTNDIVAGIYNYQCVHPSIYLYIWVGLMLEGVWIESLLTFLVISK